MSLCVLWWKNRAVGSDFVKMSSLSLCQTLTGRQAERSCGERGSGGKLMFQSGSVMWVLHALCNFSLFPPRGTSVQLQTF